MATGKVYLIGAGPGAPDLITLRGVRLLQRADVVLYDALVHPDVVALAECAQKIAVGKRCGRHSTAQRFISKRLIDAAHKHAIVIRLKGGDPMLFGRAHEELEALRAAGIECEVVPGVTSALAASAQIGVSLTRRGMSRSVTFATPRVGEDERPSNWVRSVRGADTAVLFMAAGQAAEVGRALLAGGMAADTPIVIVADATLADARSVTTSVQGLTQLQMPVDGPALILIGEVLRDYATGSVADTASGKDATRLRPLDLDEYKAMSASCSKAS